ncbi:CAF17-like 4Fe-4S cluster assembly/insertion protein YgfZ [Gluconobacter morbifer]|uniref:Aminomethyltransferase n=1 Tax=Gluconobacter morbifer G707 TaxID=1088869 RepID=G6XGW5_9PROT|nr:folate-binding protein YgfZ [Gluconobacter morbifer]EHH69423.1 aminomethyltransferase [Gluconobacter morbifer G707]
MIESLTHRSVLRFSGKDRTTFLQGLVTNDLLSLTAGQAVWSALLTPQGRWLSEFFLMEQDGSLFMDCAAAHAEMLTKRLSRFRLRADVQIEPAALHVIAGDHATPAPETAFCHAPDPRCDGAGWRALVGALPDPIQDASHYLIRRLPLGLPDVMDFEPEQTLALEGDMDLLHGISWKKGCYMGQELTARTHYRGLVRRRLLPVSLQGAPFPAEGGTILMGGREIGDLRSRSGHRGLTMLRREAWQASDLTCNGQPVTIDWPQWFPSEMRS